MAKIILIDGEHELAESIRTRLYNDGHTVKVFSSGLEALGELQNVEYDIVLLDLILPDISGLELCRQYRSIQGNGRILMITARSNTSDKESGLDAGADDYIVKPIDMPELSARIRALMRRSIMLKSNELVIEEIVLDFSARTVFRAGKEIKLLPQEFALLEFMMKERNKLFNAETLLKKLWRGNGSVGTVRTHIKSLRQKLDKGYDKQYIRTIHGVGYGFTDL